MIPPTPETATERRSVCTGDDGYEFPAPAWWETRIALPLTVAAAAFLAGVLIVGSQHGDTEPQTPPSPGITATAPSTQAPIYP